MKLLIGIPTLTLFYNYPTYSLIGIVALIFTVQVIAELCSLSSCGAEELMKSKTPINQSYEEIKEAVNSGVGLDRDLKRPAVFDINLDKEKESNYIDIKCNIPDFSLFSYRDLQKIAKSLEIKKVNRKRLVLEDELKHLLLDKEVIDLFH